ncbi:MAG: phospholipase D family protein, partial [Acidobacteriota bacterium]
CTRPPKLPFDAGTGTPAPGAVDAMIARAPLVNDLTKKVEVDSDGALYTVGDQDRNQPFTVVQEEAGPPGPHTQRLDRNKPGFLLWRYQLNPEHDPIHTGPVVYTLSVADGFGGKVELRGMCRVALGSLVIETGGPDFRIYEYRPYSFEIDYQPGRHGYKPVIEDNTKVGLSWEFAYVNEEGSAVEAAGSVRTDADLVDGKFHLVVGHTPKLRNIYIDRKEGEVAYRRPSDGNTDGDYPAIGWRKVGDSDREQSAELRKRWHAMADAHERTYAREMAFVEEDALRWLPSPGTGTDKPRAWRDRTLRMAVRIEMRTDKGYLVATSDRWAGDENGPRTPPEFIWRDHRFRYVLLVLRCWLYDNWGNPYKERKYRLTIPGARPREYTTGSCALIEEPIPADTEEGTLEILPPDGQGNDPLCTLTLKLGYLDSPITIGGQQARLNNLGLFAGPEVDGIRSPRFERAALRFQEMYKLDPVSMPDDSMQSELRLEAVHDRQGFAELPAADKPSEGSRRPATNGEPPASMLMRGKPIEDPLEPGPPEVLKNREACVALHMINTFRIPCDPKIDEAQRRLELDQWFPHWSESGYPVRPVRSGNEVLYLIDAEQTFLETIKTIRSTQGPGDFIYLLGWWLSWDLQLDLSDPQSQIGNLLKEASDRGVEVRAMLFTHLATDEKATKEHLTDKRLWLARVLSSLHPILRTAMLAADVYATRKNLTLMNEVNVVSYLKINELTHGAAILDRRLRNFGAHHQKAIVVCHGGKLTGFCGGADLNPDRLHPRGEGPNKAGDTSGAPFHDVHCRIRGPAAYDLLQNFVQRWKDHPDSGTYATPGREGPPIHSNAQEINKPLRGEQISDPDRNPVPFLLKGKGTGHYVQIGRTLSKGIYGFAEEGDRTARAMIKQAIASARRFIYIEDQYLVSEEAREWLKAALPRIHHLTILIPDSSITLMGNQTSEYRRRYLEPLQTAAPDKVRAFILKNPGGRHSYVHSKMYVVDDKYAIIGSANCNRRSFTHDSEIVAGVFDESSDARCTFHFAHQLRVALWAEHLNLDTLTGHAELADGVASGVLWLKPPPGARIAPYDLNAPNCSEDSYKLWDTMVDPDGST